MSQADTDGNTAAPEQLNDTQWIIRPYRDGDIPAIASLMNAADAVDKLGAGRTEEELTRSFAMPISDPPRQVILVEGPAIEGVPAAMPLGWGRILSLDDDGAGERIYQFGFLAHPAARSYGLESALAKRLVGMARANEARPEVKPMGKASVLGSVREERATARAALSEIGLREVRQGWTMCLPLEELRGEPEPIVDVNMRNYRLPEDNKASLQAYNNSFIDHFEYHAFPQEMWDYMVGSPNTKPALSWLAEVQDEPGKIAGFCICEIKEEENRRTGRSEGWIAMLGTIRGWRGKGLGRALLLRGLHSLKDAGVQTALLGVDAENPTGALRLYESVGFRVREHEILYKRALDEISTS